MIIHLKKQKILLILLKKKLSKNFYLWKQGHKQVFHVLVKDNTKINILKEIKKNVKLRILNFLQKWFLLIKFMLINSLKCVRNNL